ncbi:MAG: hypothetical protein COT34_00335 [Candidatus Nealsonbacteria bacterium CG08_land_8_20_14_0_20_43_11]|uniref:Uncharacterized protein n=1 Tax=Candidatus Nealsonbacteria bacterium CG08_land_8_20_14_0_20_43_11 TaxID=1974706 RepID=A0A2M6T1J7_9BACT|nr:MAG: hypothetical protein COT34_00335 [Candidatus Nealsonbacteria bacterium CG08_land_8_20_14_0_20_43_11]
MQHIDFLRQNKGYLDEPYSKHIIRSVRELMVDFAKRRHRIFYFAIVGKTIILLTAFLKQTDKTPLSVIKEAQENYLNVINNKKFYVYNTKTIK